jgi:hypothetical protein
MPFQKRRAGTQVMSALFVEGMRMSHAYLIEIDHSIVGMIILEVEGYRFYATKPALRSLHSHLFDTSEQAYSVILDRHGRSNETKSSLTPLSILSPVSFDISEDIDNELADLQSSDSETDLLLSHYQNVGLPAVVAALNQITKAGQYDKGQKPSRPPRELLELNLKDALPSRLAM